MGEQKPLGKSPLLGNPSPESSYLPTYLKKIKNLMGLYNKQTTNG